MEFLVLLIDKAIDWLRGLIPSKNKELDVYLSTFQKLFNDEEYIKLNKDKTPLLLDKLLMTNNHQEGLKTLKILEKENLRKSDKELLHSYIEFIEDLIEVENWKNNHTIGYEEKLNKGNDIIEQRKKLIINICKRNKDQ